jgi:transposase
MRPVSVFADGPDEADRLRAELRGTWRLAVRAVMVLLSLQGLPAAQIAGLPECHPATVRRWIGRFNSEGPAGLAGRPRCGRPPVGGRRLSRRIAALLQRPGPWALPRIWRHLGRPQVSMRTLYRRVRQVAIWRQPKLTARGDPDHDQVVAGIVARLLELPRRAVVCAEDERRGGERAHSQLPVQGGLPGQDRGERGRGVHLRVRQEPQFLKLIGLQDMGIRRR